MNFKRIIRGRAAKPFRENYALSAKSMFTLMMLLNEIFQLKHRKAYTAGKVALTSFLKDPDSYFFRPLAPLRAQKNPPFSIKVGFTNILNDLLTLLPFLNFGLKR